MEQHDLIIIGGSAAATAAGIYAARRNLDFKIITKDFGGEVATSGEIGNWPGIKETDGLALSQQFREHLDFYQAPIEEGIEVERIVRQDDGLFCITAKTGEMPAMAMEKMPDGHENAPKCDYLAKAVILTTGAHPRELEIPGEKIYRSKGVSYCTVCDGPLFKGRPTAVIGGGNSALEAGLMLADLASKVYILNKNPEFKGEQVLIDNLKAKSNVEIITNAVTTEIFGDQPAGGFAQGLKYKDQAGNEQSLAVEGIFVHIGMVPNSWMVPPDVVKDQFGHIQVDQNCATNVPGFFAAGDVTDVPYRQIVVAAGQGCIALLSAVNYLNKLH